MAKRNLTKQQSDRIQENQRKYIDKLGQDDSFFQAQVVAVFGRMIEVEDQSRNVYEAQIRQNLGTIVCGDQVICQREQDGCTIVSILERKTVLQRSTKQNINKLVAANVDLMCITLAIEPEYHLGLMDRYLVAAEHSHIRPLIIFNKVDLLSPQQREMIQQELSLYEALGYPVLYISSNQPGADEQQQLLTLLANHTAIFVGQSGVGKSSLLSMLLPELLIETGSLSEKGRKGKHTTTLSRLYHLPGGGQLIDSPGIRDYALSHLQENDIYQGFIELKPYLDKCQFRNCSHENEPGCAVLEAVENGEISAQRYQSLRTILEWNRSF